jgi:type II secretory pathway component GspD/PulD (secretin)
MVKDGVTIIIGGLIKEEKLKTTKKVPFIGDVPLLGTLFKNVSDSVGKTEIVIFLTPRIITGELDEKSKDKYERMVK